MSIKNEITFPDKMKNLKDPDSFIDAFMNSCRYYNITELN